MQTREQEIAQLEEKYAQNIARPPILRSPESEERGAFPIRRSWAWARGFAFANDSADELHIPRTFVNEHLSVSRLKLFEQCGEAFAKRYIEKIKGDYGEAAMFGVMLHAVLERVFVWAKEEEFVGRFPDELAHEIYREEWARCDMRSISLYQEGLEILRLYGRKFPDVDARSILAVEQEFNIDLDGYKMNGYIDRVDRISDDWISIVDYKSNRMLFSKEELNDDLQFPVYGLAARVLWPWAKKVTFAFHMLRHGVAQTTERTAEQLDATRGYVAWLGRRTESRDEKFEQRLNPFCGYCDHRHGCDTHKKALAGDYEFVKVTDQTALDEIAALQWRTSNVAKLAYKRKKELEEAIKVRLRVLPDRDGSITAGGVTYRLGDSTKNVYPADRVLKAFQALGIPEEQLAPLVTVSNGDVEELLDRVLADPKYDRAKMILTKARIESLAERVPQTPRIDARLAKDRTTVPDEKKGKKKK